MGITFEIVFEGEIRSGENLTAVKRRIAELYRVDYPKIEPIFSNYPIVLKRVDKLGKGIKYVTALRRAGLISKIVRST